MCIHSGSNSDILRQLAEFGLDERHTDCFFEGLVATSLAAQGWLEQRRAVEETAGAVS